MKTIVAPTDFSPISLNAVNYAADMASAMNAGLSLLHVCRMPMVFGDVPTPAYHMEEMTKEAEERIAQLKKDISERVGTQLKVDTAVVPGLVVTTEIESFCGAINPYAVVIGTQGAGAAERLFYGANTLSVMKNLSYPVIVVPPQAQFAHIRKIGLACDLKRVAETAPVREIRELVNQFKAALHIMHVNRESEPVYTPEIIEESGQLQEMLNDLHPVYHFLNNKGVEEGLTEFAEKNNLDLLIVVPKKHNLFDKLFHKSHTKKLMLETHVPVMSVHQKAVDTALYEKGEKVL